MQVSASARVTETTAPLYYTLGMNKSGIYHNAFAAWELYGPGEEDYRVLTPPGLEPRAVTTGRKTEVITEFGLNRPGQYRLRVAAVDLAGRSTVVWTPITVTH